MMSDVKKLLSGLDSKKWEDKFFISMVGFLSCLLKKNDSGEGFDFTKKPIDENKDFIYDLIQSTEYDEKLRLELRDFMEVILNRE